MTKNATDDTTQDQEITSKKIMDILDSAPKAEAMVDEQESTNHDVDAVNKTISPKHQELLDQVTLANAKANEHWDKYVRTKAEMDNQQRRFERDLEKARKFGVEKLVNELLIIVDTLERALENKGTAEAAVASLYEGVALTLKMFLDTLAKFSVTQINPLGEKFNATFHEAIATQENTEQEAGMVIAVLQKGYLLQDRLIRPARVVVAK